MSVYFSEISTGVRSYDLPFHSSHKWKIEGGFTPKTQAWVVPADIAAQIAADVASLSGGSSVVPAELRLAFGDKSDPISVARVILLGVGPADNPQRRTLYFTDVRFYLTFAWICMDVNIRRRVGDQRLVGGELVPGGISVDTVAYAGWSIDGSGSTSGTPEAYRWNRYRDQVLHVLTSEIHGRPQLAYVVDTFNLISIPAQIVQETTSDSNGNSGLARAIESVPGAGLYVDLTGTIHVYERVPGAEVAVVSQLSKSLMGHGDLVFVDNRAFRPRSSATSWRCYVNYEVEICFRYDVTRSWGVNDPYLQPVLKVTDKGGLLIPAGTWGPARTVGEGSWITQEEAFAAWGSTTRGLLVLPQLTDTIVANHWFGNGLQHYAMGVDGTHDPIWLARVQEVRRCWRTYFRVNPNCWDRIRHAWTVRAAVWDPTTGTRAPSPVFSNYNVTEVNPYSSVAVTLFGTNVVTSYPASGLIADGYPTGFEVGIVDMELGIVFIDREVEKFAGASEVAPSPVIQVAGIADDDTSLAEVCLQKMVPADEWQLALILSVSPGAPNDLGRLYEIPVSMAEAAEAAGLAAGFVTTGGGPDQETRTQLADARMAWIDRYGDQLLSLIGANDTTSAITSESSLSFVQLPPINLVQELQPLGKAVAAAELLNRLDGTEGKRSVPTNSDTARKLVPLGTIVSVTHEVRENRLVSTIECDNTREPFHAVDFLTASARSFLLKEIQNKR